MEEIQKQLKQHVLNLTATEYVQILLSGLFGVGICILTTAIVDAVLVEISISFVFSTYFGICFILIGVLLVMRVNTLPESSPLQTKKQYLFAFSLLVLLSGIICFFLERDWNKSLTYAQKIPLYIILGISLDFTLIFSLLDIVNFFIGLFQKSRQRTMVETENQIISVLFLSTIMGSVCGFLFSIMDIEVLFDIRNFYALERKLIKEEHYCMPIAILLGFLGGTINEFIRIIGNFASFKFERVIDPFQEEI